MCPADFLGGDLSGLLVQAASRTFPVNFSASDNTVYHAAHDPSVLALSSSSVTLGLSLLHLWSCVHRRRAAC